MSRLRMWNFQGTIFIWTTIMNIIFWDFLILYQISLSPQVKRSVFISNKHDIYELPQELPNDLKLIRKLGKITKISKLYRVITHCLVLPPKLKIFLKLAESCWKIEIKAFLHCAIPHENQSLPHIPCTRL